jgi:uncharacterized membrane protein YsdA (DUF1294 family)
MSGGRTTKAQRSRSEQAPHDIRVGSGNFALWLPAGFLLFVGIGALMNGLPWAIPAIYMIGSLTSFAWYRQDKRKAQRGEWRTPESTLHFLDLLGGWPGGLIAQRAFRHKTRKLSFQIIFWFSVLLHLAGWLWIFLKVPSETRLPHFIENLGRVLSALSR